MTWINTEMKKNIKYKYLLNIKAYIETIDSESRKKKKKKTNKYMKNLRKPPRILKLTGSKINIKVNFKIRFQP